MRLVCPNCEAKYEVPDDAIPDSGRDVQCANCGHAWFQTRSRAVSSVQPVTQPQESPAVSAVTAEPAPEPAPVGAAVAETPAEPHAEKPAETPLEKPAERPAAETRKADKKATAPAAAVPVPPVAPVAAEASAEDSAEAAVPRAVDEKVLSILREEAEREAKARRDDGRPIESQPDLGIDTTGSKKKGAAKKAAVEPEPDVSAKPAARRDLLPDVEEINSTLRPSENADSGLDLDGSDQDQREGRGAFRAGFLLVIAFAILGASVYISAAWLASVVPALAGPLAVFVSLVDGLRLELDGLMQSATRLISGEGG